MLGSFLATEEHIQTADSWFDTTQMDCLEIEKVNSEKGRDTCNNRNKEHYVARKVYLWLSAKA